MIVVYKYKSINVSGHAKQIGKCKVCLWEGSGQSETKAFFRFKACWSCIRLGMREMLGVIEDRR